VYKRQIYQIAESNRIEKIDSVARIESNRNFFARIGMLYCTVCGAGTKTVECPTAHLLCRLTAAAVDLLLSAGVGSRYRSVRGPSFYIAFIQHSYNINPALAHKKIIYMLLNLSIALKPGMSLLISNSHRKKSDDRRVSTINRYLLQASASSRELTNEAQCTLASVSAFMRSNHGVSRKYWTNLDWLNYNLNYHHEALKCLRQLLVIRRQAYDRVRYDEILQRTGLTSLSHLSSRRRISVFRHVARLDDYTPANMALQLHINVPLNRPPGLWRQREFKVGGRTTEWAGVWFGGKGLCPPPKKKSFVL